MKKSLIIYSICLVLLVPVSYARDWNPQIKGRGVDTVPNLTTEQREKMDNLRQAFMKESLVLHDELGAKIQDLNILQAQPSSDAAKIKAHQKEIFNLQQQLQKKSKDYYSEARTFLTPEQIAALPPGCDLGFSAGKGYAPGICNGKQYARGRRGYDQGMGYGKNSGCRRGKGYRRSQGCRNGNGSGVNYVDADGNGVCDLFENSGRRR